MKTALSQQIFQMMAERYPNLPESKNYHGKWSYDLGVILMGYRRAYETTGEQKYFDYIKETMDYFVQEDGTIKGYQFASQNLDHVNNGKLLFVLYKETGAEKYKTAMDKIFEQLQHQPRTASGGFWHKQIYPNQMWLDGIYMGSPFYAEYVLTFKNGEGLDDVMHQFELIYQNTLDAKTGLLYHAYDEARVQPWADKTTGHAPHFWGRAMGWYMLALTDTMSLLKKDSAEFNTLADIFNKCLAALRKVQDDNAHVWYQVLDLGARHGNYLEASCSSMFVAASAAAVKLGVLPASQTAWVKMSYQGLLDEFVLTTKEGWVNLLHNCEVAGLGGDDMRDGSFVYYVSEPIITNDFKGLGAFLQASLAVENL